MESCKSENMAKSGWSRQEDKLLFSQAEQARNEGRPLKSVFEAVAEQTGGSRTPRNPKSIYGCSRKHCTTNLAVLETTLNIHKESCRTKN